MSKLFKRGVSFDGMDCIKDSSSAAYMQAGKASQSAVSWYYQANYAKFTVYFGVVVIFIACIKNIWYRSSDKVYLKSHQKSLNPSLISSLVAVSTSYGRYIGYKPINSYICRVLALPTSLGSLLFVIASTAYLACYCFIPHYWYRGCSGFGTPPLAIRAGVMATAITPFLYVLSGKSNMITLLTGISYEKLNGFHQWAGVITLILSIIHVVPFMYQAMAEGGASFLAETFSSKDYWSGYPPFVLLVVLCVGGNSWFRSRIYEGFLHLHWMCGIAYFATLVWHINNALDMQRYMWGALAFWATQLIYRALVKTAFRPSALFLKPRPATLTKLPKGTYEVVVTNVADMKWNPGQHCYLRFAGSRILDNHPFSICSVPSTVSADSNELRFIIVPKKGLTGKLYKELDESITLKKKVFLDGPYGGTVRDPLSFDNLSLISSGSGVTVCLPFLTHVTQHIAKSIEAGTAFIPKDIHFVWIIRHEEHIDWIREQLEQAVSIAGDYVTIDIYVANRKEIPSDKTGTIDSPAETEKCIDSSYDSRSTFPMGINIHYLKPNIEQIVLDSEKYLNRKTMFVSSGSGSMRKSVGSGVSSLQTLVFNSDMNSRPYPIEEIYLHTEAFGW
ncbi:ferric/cupric reductase transmembrane component 7 [[Candida] anglica]